MHRLTTKNDTSVMHHDHISTGAGGNRSSCSYCMNSNDDHNSGISSTCVVSIEHADNGPLSEWWMASRSCRTEASWLAHQHFGWYPLLPTNDNQYSVTIAGRIAASLSLTAQHVMERSTPSPSSLVPFLQLTCMRSYSIDGGHVLMQFARRGELYIALWTSHRIGNGSSIIDDDTSSCGRFVWCHQVADGMTLGNVYGHGDNSVYDIHYKTIVLPHRNYLHRVIDGTRLRLSVTPSLSRDDGAREINGVTRVQEVHSWLYIGIVNLNNDNPSNEYDITNNITDDNGNNNNGSHILLLTHGNNGGHYTIVRLYSLLSLSTSHNIWRPSSTILLYHTYDRPALKCWYLRHRANPLNAATEDQRYWLIQQHVGVSLCSYTGMVFSEWTSATVIATRYNQFMLLTDKEVQAWSIDDDANNDDNVDADADDDVPTVPLLTLLVRWSREDHDTGVYLNDSHVALPSLLTNRGCVMIYNLFHYQCDDATRRLSVSSLRVSLALNGPLGPIRVLPLSSSWIHALIQWCTVGMTPVLPFELIACVIGYAIER
jgi:hypothetical protein